VCIYLLVLGETPSKQEALAKYLEKLNFGKAEREEILKFRDLNDEQLCLLEEKVIQQGQELASFREIVQ